MNAPLPQPVCGRDDRHHRANDEQCSLRSGCAFKDTRVSRVTATAALPTLLGLLFGTRGLGASRACTLRSRLSRPNVSVIQKKSGSSASGASILEHRSNQVVCCRLSCRLLLTVGP